ncbi:UvrD-helicase domain-containing protein [Pectobacterium parmentieri]|uniref:UvrD-helicase domain-containing protein n=1 Tax=Pectobacterium parmentieri TaxID=1905730 RepID=UPI00051A0976|nr:ATP-dependent helicase [Pectobacterium parmentieri]AOR59602.1 ATP-dependent DNA helicase [Pectobacterium parmentieri]QQK71509.1 ATP-dependent helicase [Pectobacterium versatile]
MTKPSPEQAAIINAPLVPMSVIACAGSGKTHTAVRRLAEMRRLLGSHRGRVALLSFSNIAVDTFRQSYQSLALEMSVGPSGHRVDINTLDGFITRHVLHPHAHRTMQATQAAFLVTGGESFLNSFSFKPGNYPVSIMSMQVGWRDSGIYFYYVNNDQVVELNHGYASAIVHRLGTVGAYTHNLGRYWCYRTLREQPVILRALARRYPHILIDEAQDIGTLHQAILEQLINAGVQVSLIGDPNQAIYEFAGANGRFLSQYGTRSGVIGLKLTRNYRSVPPILELANKLSDRSDDPDRIIPETAHGAYFIPYRTADRDNLVHTFQATVIAAGLMLERSAVLCRGRDFANKLAGNESPAGQGAVKGFAQAAISRDKNQDYVGAFKGVAICIAGLLVNLPKGWVATVTHPASYPEAQPLRRLIWRFTRNPDTGLPSASLQADTEWHPLLLTRVKALLATLEKDHGLKPVNNIGMKLAKKKLPNVPLATTADLAASNTARIRVDTVHQAKGENLDAVLYMATKEHVTAMLDGVDSEVGRIGYVAVTRARDLLWLGVPANSLSELRPKLVANGFQEIGIPALLTT